MVVVECAPRFSAKKTQELPAKKYPYDVIKDPQVEHSVTKTGYILGAWQTDWRLDMLGA